MATSRPGPRRKPDSETETERVYRGVVFASSEYVGWVFGRLRLGNANLDRMQTSGVPVLRSHNGDAQVGEVVRVSKEPMTGLWRADWRLPKIEANSRTFEQLDSGLMRGVSVGGRLNFASITVDNEDPVEDLDDLLLTADWELIEQSMTPIPADVNSGIDRTTGTYLFRDGQLFDLLIGPDSIRTPESTALRSHIGSLMREHNQTISLRRETAMTMQTIPADILERAVNEKLAGDTAAKQLTDLVSRVEKLATDSEAEAVHNMEFRSKVDRMQFQPGGQVLQLGNWKASDPVIDLGKVLRLTQTSDAGFPALDREFTTLEESAIERAELSQPGRNVVARVPWSVLEERERQLQLQRSTMADAAGSRPVMIDVLGNGGLVLSSWSPILARMDTRFGVVGAQKAPWLTTQPAAAGGAEGSDIPVTNLVVNNVEYLPRSLASAYELTSSLRGVDDGTFEGMARMAIGDVLLDQVTGQILDGGGTNELDGLWSLTGVQETKYGAAQSDFTRQDALDFLDSVRLSKTDGGAYTGVLSTTFWKLCESVLRGGTSSDHYLLELDGMMAGGQGMMGRMESEMMYHYADLSPASIVDPALFFKADRIVVWFWGDSLFLEYVPTVSRKETFKMVAEVNFVSYRPVNNVSKISQGT